MSREVLAKRLNHSSPSITRRYLGIQEEEVEEILLNAILKRGATLASCETVFVPPPANKPVVALSNNDDCLLARSAEAKTFGIPMGKTAYEGREFFRRHDVAWTPR